MNIVWLAMKLLQNRDRLAKIKELFPGLDQGQPSEPGQSDYPVGSVEWLQDSLNQLNNSTTLEVDGKLGPATYDAVREYQEIHDLKVDGYAGVETIASIIEELGKQT